MVLFIFSWVTAALGEPLWAPLVTLRGSTSEWQSQQQLQRQKGLGSDSGSASI